MKFIVNILASVLYVILICEAPVPANERIIACYNHDIHENALDFCEDKDKPKENSIFFHETSCYNKYDSIVINSRQACAVESAARLHPERTVYLLYNSPIKYNNDSTRNPRSSRLVHELLKYPNIRIRRIRIDRYVKNTPLENWPIFGRLKTSRYPTSHASDILRFVTLWKYGGTYLDLDVIVMRSLEDLGHNFIGLQDGSNLAAGVMNFDHDNLGHSVVTICLSELYQGFQGQLWGHNSVGLISRVLWKLCNQSYSETPCNEFKILKPRSFYPISYGNWDWYFSKLLINFTLTTVRDSYIAHVWNSYSFNERVNKSDMSRTAYGAMASKFCPFVYSIPHEVF